MTKLPLTIATTDYDHFRDIRSGVVQPEGIDLNWLLLGHHECFARMTLHREFDLAEMSFAKFSTQVTREDSDLIGLPVICSRLFRFSSFYVNRKSGIEKIEDSVRQDGRQPRMGPFSGRLDARLDAKRPCHGHDPHQVGAGRGERGGARRKGRTQPAGRDRDYARQGQVAVGNAGQRRSRLRDHRPPADLFSRTAIQMWCGSSRTSWNARKAQYAETGVWPIMHIVAMKRSVLAAHPWAARNLYAAFDESRRAECGAHSRSGGVALSRGLVADLCPQDAGKTFGKDLFPFGIEANRKTWEMMGLYTYQQGIAHRQFAPEEIFPETIETKVII